MRYAPPAGDQVGLPFNRRNAVPGGDSAGALFDSPNAVPAGDAAGASFGTESLPPAGDACAVGFSRRCAPPHGDAVALAFTQRNAPPAGDRIGLDFSPQESVGSGSVQYVTAQGLEPAPPSEPVIRLAVQFVRPPGAEAPAAPAAAQVFLRTTYVRPPALSAFAAGNATLRNRWLQAWPPGLAATHYGATAIWNWRQYQPLRGYDAALYGEAYVQGGVKYIEAFSVNGLVYGRATVINTTADQTAAPAGIAAPAVGRPDVSPRTLWPSPIYGTLTGFALVQFPPQPRGWLSDAFGYASIEYKTKYLGPQGIDSFAGGYAVVRDRAQHLLHRASGESAIFGDTHLRLKVRKLAPEGFDAFEGSRFAEVRSTRRFLLAAGFNAADFGDAASRNKTPSLTPSGLDALALGEHHIGWRVRKVLASGVPMPFAPVPAPLLWQTPWLAPRGVAAPAIEPPSVWYRVRSVSAKGSDTARFGTVEAGFRYRLITLEGEGRNLLAAGLPRIEHGRRTVLASGSAFEQQGRPWASFRVRLLDAEGIEQPKSISQHMVGGSRMLRPDGFDAAAFGERIIPEIQTLAPPGFTGQFGPASIRSSWQFLRPQGVTTYPQPSQHWGNARVWNLRQIIKQYFIIDSDLNPPPWPIWTHVANRNRNVRPSGMDASRFGLVAVVNGARAILSEGWVSQAMPSGAMVAYRVRHLPLEGLEPPYISRWTAIANDASVVAPRGYDASAAGSGLVETNRRFITWAGNFDAQWFERPFVAPRVRTVAGDGRYAIAPPHIAPPDVQLHTRYLEHTHGTEAPQVGRAALHIVWRGIIPHWTHRDYFGEPRLHNVTPELRGQGYAMDEWGATHVRLQWRPVAPDGSNTALFGRTAIADKCQRIYPPGRDYFALGDRLRVYKIGGLPEPQTISLHQPGLTGDEVPGHIQDGYGIERPKNQVPAPTLNQQVLYVHSATPLTLFGTARADSNGIRVEPGIAILGVGEPAISLYRRKVSAKATNTTTVVGQPRLSPHTIWAVKEAPEQAIENHKKVRLHYVWEDSSGRTGARVGSGTYVQNQNREVRVHGVDAASVMRGSVVFNARQYVAPEGKHHLRFGWPSIPGPQTIAPSGKTEVALYGATSVARGRHYGPQTIAPPSLPGQGIERHEIQLWQRRVTTQGWASELLGARKYGDSPYMWQGLRIGPHVPTQIGGLLAEAFGQGFVSLRVREVRAVGEDMFASEYDYTAFVKRMRVRNARPSGPAPQRVMPVGLSSSACGWAQARPMRHYIRPDGNAAQHRKGAPTT